VECNVEVALICSFSSSFSDNSFGQRCLQHCCGMADKVSREERRRQKELEEQRKLGNAPAEVDEEGKYVHCNSHN
jgi:hypothetical protein